MMMAAAGAGGAAPFSPSDIANLLLHLDADAITGLIDGAQHFTTATNTVGFDGTPFLGRNIDNDDVWLDGDVAEMLVYGAALSAGDRSDVWTYLNNKWGL